MGHLNLSGNRITDISALSEMENTVLLYLNKNRIADISCLKNMVKLQTLKIDQNKITDISVIEHLPELKHMYVAQNAIADISPLAGMNSGIYFGDLSGNQITDLSPLYDTVLDNILLIYDNPIQDGSAIQSLKFAGKGSLVISYDAGIDWTQVYASDGSLTTLVVLDVPGEREYDVKRDSPVNSVSFKSIEDYFSDESGESDEN